MYRQAMITLENWKKSKNRKPLIIHGARQVGKTWLMKEFARIYYQQCAYINFDNNDRMKTVFMDNFDIPRIIMALQIESGVKIEAENTLLVFDEIQEVPKALHSLKYFYENAPEYHLVAAGSLLGIAHHKDSSFPIGKVDFLNLYPLSFSEFLNANGQTDLLHLLEKQDFRLIRSFKNNYIDLLKQYYYIGGMPEPVNSFIENKDLKIVREIQKRIMIGYEQDFSKHAPGDTVIRIRMLWDSIPSQLSKENRKFIYSLIKKGARAREFEAALLWLHDCGLVYKIFRITKPGIPLKAYQDFNAFKLYFLDIGLLGALSDLDAKSIIKGNTIFVEFKGALTEQFILQQLIAENNILPFYWSVDKGTAEIDFIIQRDDTIFPIEVKATENLQAKSLKSYYQKYNPVMAIRSSLSDYRVESWLINVPLYALSMFLKK